MSSNTSTVAVKEKHIMCHIKRQQFHILGRRVQALYNPSKGLLTDAVSDQNRRCVTGKERKQRIVKYLKVSFIAVLLGQSAFLQT